MKKEIRVYVINCDESDLYFKDKERQGDLNAIIEEAERLGSVYSLSYFQDCINNQDFDLSNSFILIY